MTHLPIFVALSGQPCLVVGGGEVALRKVEQLRAAGASVTVNAPDLSPALAALAAAGQIAVVQRPFDASLVAAQLLVIAATSDRAVNTAVATAAAAAGRLCNVVDDPELSSFISPSVVDRSPLLVAVSSGGLSPVLARTVRQQLERWLPLRLGDLAGWAGRWRTAVKARIPAIDDRRRFWESLFDGIPAREHGIAGQVLAGRVADADAAMADALATAGGAARRGTPAGEAWLVGAGPGDAGLLTLRGLQLLQQAEVVLHDRLIGPGLLSFARRDAELVDVGKTGGGESMPQEAINALLIEHVRAGRRVCRLKGGDPYVFGRGSEEALALAAAGLPFQVVPGVTAASGCGAYAGIPLTHRDHAHAVTFVSAHLAPGNAPDWSRLAGAGQTLVVYMSGRRVGEVAAQLLHHGRAADTPAAVVMAGTLSRQRVVSGTLADIGAALATAGVESPAILYVGEVVALSKGLQWFQPTIRPTHQVHAQEDSG